MNVHLFQHLPECVKWWGPLWVYSSFHFESMNGQLKSLFHGTRDMTKQVVNYCFIPSGVNMQCSIHFTTNGFSYIVMQSLPPTLANFQHWTTAVSTFTSIIYGKKRCMILAYIHARHECVHLNCFTQGAQAGCEFGCECTWRGVIEGGFTLFVPALEECLQIIGLDLPPGPLRTLYCIEVWGIVYYSRQYKEVKDGIVTPLPTLMVVV